MILFASWNEKECLALYEPVFLICFYYRPYSQTTLYNILHYSSHFYHELCHESSGFFDSPKFSYTTFSRWRWYFRKMRRDQQFSHLSTFSENIVPLGNHSFACVITTKLHLVPTQWYFQQVITTVAWND